MFITQQNLISLIDGDCGVFRDALKKLIKLDDVRRAYKKMLLPNYSITEHNSTKRKNREV